MVNYLTLEVLRKYGEPVTCQEFSHLWKLQLLLYQIEHSLRIAVCT